MNKKEVKRVPINISLLPDDKKFLKLYALQHDMTVSTLIESWIRELQKKENK